MDTIMTISAMVTGFPARLTQPQPLPGETMVDLVIRNHPQQWRNFLERLISQFGLSKSDRDRLLNSRISHSDFLSFSPKIQEEFEEFTNHRIPNVSRTMQSLVDLQHLMNDPVFQRKNRFTLVEILWPRQRISGVDTSGEEIAAKMGIKTILIPPNASRILDLANFLPHIHGELVWFVPGGTVFMSRLVINLLGDIVYSFATSPKCAFYTDNADSVIYRTASLQELLRRGKNLAAGSRDIAAMLVEAGYKLTGDKDYEFILCKLEEEYGGRGR